MKMDLNVLERIILLNILPKEENYLTFKMISTLKADLSFTDEEFKKFGITTLKDGRISWTKGEATKEIDVPDTLKILITEKLKTLEKDKKINEENASLYEKFVLDVK